MITKIPEEVRCMLDSQTYSMLEIWIEASERYYSDAENTTMPDTEFDKLQQEIIELGIDSVTNFVTKTIFRDGQGMVFVKEETRSVVDYINQQMISLNKIKWQSKATVSEIIKFFGQNILKTHQLYYGTKFDGAAIKVIWDLEKRVIKMIQTRGGMNVTETFKDMPSIKETIKYNKPVIAGEMVVEKKTFNERYSVEGDNEYEYENARNFVGAMVKVKNLEQDIIDDLIFVACTDGINPLLESKVWNKITDMQQLYTLDKIAAMFKIESFPYLCDGIVLAFVETGERRVKDNYPLNMVSVKFQGAQAETIVTDMFYTQKKSGKLTPMLRVKPVPLDGITATKANGYNYGKVLDKGIGIGAKIIIERSGDIIPIVAKVVTRVPNAKIKMPDVEYRRQGKHLIAVDLEESRIYKFILGLKVLQIDGIGDTLADIIGNVPSIDYDIMNLFNPEHKPDICKVLGDGKKWQDFQEVYQVKSMPLDMLIHLLQFDQVGPKNAKKVAMLITKQTNKTDNLPNEVLQHVARGEGFKRIKESIDICAKLGIKILKPVITNNETITYELSGDPNKSPLKINKAEFQKRFKQLYTNSEKTTLTRSTKLLICLDPEANGGKCNKARKYNVPMVSYVDALNGKLSKLED